MSLDEPEPIDSVLTILSGYNTLEYSCVKATAVSVRLRILFVTLQNTNKLSGAVAGERQLHYLRTQSSTALHPKGRVLWNTIPWNTLFYFLFSTSTPATHGAAILSTALHPKGRVL